MVSRIFPTFSAVLAAFIISDLAESASIKNAFNLPSFSPFETGILFAETVDKPQIAAKSCEESIVANLEQSMDNAGINLRTNFSSIFTDNKNFEKMCSEYLDQKKLLNSCPEPKRFIHKFGVVAFLELTCLIKKEQIQVNAECIAEMENNSQINCHHACISKNYKGMDRLMKKDISLHCEISSCISRCINQQVQECGPDSKLKNLHNELAGTQMLLGIEYILGAGSEATTNLVQSSQLPSLCRRSIWRSVIAASNFSGYPTEPTKDDINPF